MMGGRRRRAQLKGYGTRAAKRNVSEGFWTVIFSSVRIFRRRAENGVPRAGGEGMKEGVGRTHKDPPLGFRVLSLARPRTGTRSFMVDAGEMKSSTTLWCQSARFESRIPDPNASVSTVERDTRCVRAGYTRKLSDSSERLH